MGRKLIHHYCELEFLDDLFSKTPMLSYLNEDEEKLKWDAIITLVYRKSILKISSKSALKERVQNPYFKKLLKSSITGGSVVKETHMSQDEALKNNKSARAIISSDSIKLKSHLLLLNPKSWPAESQKLNVYMSIKVSKDYKINEFRGWHEVFSKLLKCNAAIIADNYLLDKNAPFEKNIGEIICNLLPPACPVDFHLSIIVGRNQPTTYLSRVYDDLSGLIKQLKHPYKVVLSLYSTHNSEPHDRDIITNYWWLHSGHSMNYYNRNGKITKSTTLSITGLSQLEGDRSTEILREYQRVLSKAKPGHDLIGNGINRLIDL